MKRQGSASQGLEMESHNKAMRASLRQADEIAARLLSAFQSAFPDAPSEPGIRGGAGPAAALSRVVSASPPSSGVPVAPSSNHRAAPIPPSSKRAVPARLRPDPRTAVTEPAIPLERSILDGKHRGPGLP
ncbi:MAG: hypothetical protein QM820_21985 [Minicystis sp.]